MKRILVLILPVLFLIPTLRAQYYGVEKEFTKNTSLGLQLGTSMVLGDVPVDLRGSFELGLNLQKVISRPLDFRFQFHYGNTYGLDTSPSTGILNNTSLNGVCFDCGPTPINYLDTLNPANSVVYHNFHMKYYDASFQFKLNLNRLIGKEGGENWDLYIFAGAGTMLYSTFSDMADANGAEYNFAGITETSPDKVRSILVDMLDGTYETFAQQDVVNKTGFGQYGLSGLFTGGAGFRFKLSDKLAVGLEGRVGFVTDDLLDGQQWNNDNTLTSDNDMPLSGTLTLEYIFPVKE